MELSHKYYQQPFEFFNVFSENQPPKEENSMNHKGQVSSSADTLVSTEISLSSAFSSSSSSKTKTIHTHHSRKRKSSEPNNNKPSSSDTEKQESESFDNNDFCSTTLKLYDDPWKIKKVLTASDTGKLNRLVLLSSDLWDNLLVPVPGNNNNNEELLKEGVAVRVWDVETMTMHVLILKRWVSFKNYVLIGDWNHDFVKRRALKKGDEIGLHWDFFNRCFNFSVLKRVMQSK